ncbi:hypothetical protein [Fibrella forsythiae]|uniref:Uncharacterized protein n=1 Tax=Fibrella forsythiae TaxID=2817061 RepID=A0ABS3JBA7_9BACT|nr:hypothetical protein [Fibrella forsythiae]MBO0947275.1 hypothetical protein [Fibrella forsythiae]
MSLVYGTQDGGAVSDTPNNELAKARAFDLPISTDACLPGNEHALSEAELLADALLSYQTKLIGQVKDMVSGSFENRSTYSLDNLTKYLTEGEFVADMEHIKRLSDHLSLINGHCSATLRLIYGENPRGPKR